MSYYKDRLNAIKTIDLTLDNARSNNENLKVSGIIFEITKKFPVSPNIVQERLDLRKQMSNDFIIMGDILEWL